MERDDIESKVRLYSLQSFPPLLHREYMSLKEIIELHRALVAKFRRELEAAASITPTVH